MSTASKLRSIAISVGLATMVACGGDDEATATSSTDASTAADNSGDSGDATANGESTGQLPTSTTGSSSEGSEATTETTSETTGDPGDTTGGEPPAGACTPDGLFFFPQASISFDFDAESCAMLDAEGTDPQLVFDVRDTGLTDITARGLSISSSSTGTFVNPQAVVGITVDVPTTLQATSDADGSPVTVVFEIRSKGPSLDAEVTFGE